MLVIPSILGTLYGRPRCARCKVPYQYVLATLPILPAPERNVNMYPYAAMACRTKRTGSVVKLILLSYSVQIEKKGAARQADTSSSMWKINVDIARLGR